ncbi:Uncharacterised protein [Halioglobus japonicus]|nr:Uncharacterised protein [Halioglobus japonicus]
MFLPRLSFLLPNIGGLVFGLFLLIHAGLAQSQDNGRQVVDDYRTIEWIDLMPEEDLEALLNPPDYIGDIVDGSPEDQIVPGLEPAPPQVGNPFEKVEQEVLNQLANSSEAQRYQDALFSRRVISQFDGQGVRVPGFIVPLEFDENQNVTQFFLVPYFGACIHVPPPPPNQIIYAEYSMGFKLDSMYDPVWIEGVLSTTLIENETATAAYSIKVDRLEAFTE